MSATSIQHFDFEVLHESSLSRARVGRIYTPHGIIDTPNFVAVGTNGSLKALDNSMVSEMGLQLMFCNTYHLMLQPGTSVVKQAGGLHKFIGRDQPIITDSGGFQVFSLAYGSVANELKGRGCKQSGDLVLKITEEGVLFRSYRDGAKVLLTPETSVQAQKDLGADIIIPFDELPPYHIEKEALIQSLERTHRWEKRSLDAHLQSRNGQAMYAVIHGGVDLELRKKSCAYLTSLDFDGFAIGGSMGKTKDEMMEILAGTLPQLPREKPNHLLGIGDLDSIDQGVLFGIDTFDSSYPTRAARHGVALTEDGPIKILARGNKTNFSPIDRSCACFTCQNYSIAYIQHLFKANELTAYQLASIHNVQYMIAHMRRIREAILHNSV